MFIIVCSTYIHVLVLEPKPFNLTKPRPRSVPMPEKVNLILIKALKNFVLVVGGKNINLFSCNACTGICVGNGGVIS